MAEFVFVLGAQKAGTTWLHTQLSTHPQIMMSDPKELNFFNDSKSENEEAWKNYLTAFPDRHVSKYIGESTTGYLWTTRYPKTPKRIRTRLGKSPRFVIILRHPVERAISAYLHHFRQGRLRGDERLQDIADRHGILDIGHYKRHITVWQKHFPSDRFLVLLFDDIKSKPKQLIWRVFSFLDLPLKPVTNPHKRVHEGFSLKFRRDKICIDRRFKIKNAKHIRKLRFLMAGEYCRMPEFTNDDINFLYENMNEDIEFCINNYGAPDYWRNIGLENLVSEQ